MPSQWLAVEAEMDPLKRARELQRSWEHLLAGRGLGPEPSPGAIAGLRPTILESWRRSLATGLDPTDLLAPIEADESEVLERWLEHPLASLTHVLTEQLQKVAEESRSIVVVTDASGLVLHRLGDQWLKERAAEMNLVEGALYSETADGTNGIGTALAKDHAFQVFAFEHFNERHHQWVCSGAPVHDPVSGRVIGLIDLSSLWKNAHPRSLELVTTAAKTIEQCLADARRDRDARLRRRYSDLMTRGTDLLVDRDGYVLDGAEPAHPSPFDIPAGGGEVVLGDGSFAVAEPIGHGEAYLLRQPFTRGARSAPVEALERAEERAHELATEQAALRQVATLVARESSPDQLFALVTEQVARIFDVPHVRLVRYEPDGSVVVGGFSADDHEPFPIGSRWPLDTPGVTATVRQTGCPARVENYAQVTGEIAAVVRGAGMRSSVASPIVVAGQLWGALVVLTPRHEPLPAGTESRLTDFAELVATAIANAESRVAIGRLADEQAALRRVATLVAQEVSQAQVFDAIAREAMQLLRTDALRIIRYDGESGVVIAGSGEPAVTPPGFRFPLDGETVAARIYRQGEPSRQDDYADLSGPIAESVRAAGIRSVVGAPVLVGGRLWGAITTGMTREEPLPPDTEVHLGEFTALMATAISNAEARAEVERLAEEQAALRRVATLVARDVPSEEIFSAVSEEVSRLVGSDMAVVVRFEEDERPAILFVGVSNVDVVSPGTRWELEDGMTAAKVFRTGRSARSRVGELKPGPAAETSARLGILSTVASPIALEGRLWGAVVASSMEELPLDTEDRVKKFTELVATAISNAESREARAVLTEEQAALRRVATLVARGFKPEEVFQAVAAEVGVLFGSDTGAIVRFEDDRTVTVLGAVTGPHEVGKRVALDPGSAVDLVRETGRSARFDTDDPSAPDMPSLVQALGIRSAVASPIVVEGELWGAITTASLEGPLPLGAERRLTEFTELVATAVANTQAREEVTMLADEQAALRQVAVLVAQQPSPSEVFTAVTEAVGLLLDADLAVLHVFPGDGMATTVANWGADGPTLPVGSRFPLDGDNLVARIFESGAPARMYSHEEAWERAATRLARSLRVRSAVGAPILVEGKLWGALMAATRGVEPWAENAETRIAQFTELVATAIANAEARAEVERLAVEQAALRRVATLVARGAPPEDIFAAAVDEVAGLLPVASATMGRFEPDDTVTTVASWSTSEAVFPTGRRWPTKGKNVAWMVLQTRRSARIDDFSDATDPIGVAAREAGHKSAVGSPIVVEGDLWGVITATSSEGPLPPDTEKRLASFTELVATAISNAESREARAVLTEEQAALRRVATIVARDAASTEVFEAVATEVGKLLDSDVTVVGRYDGDGSATAIGSWSSSPGGVPVGTRSAIGGHNVLTIVAETGKSARVDGYDDASGEAAEIARRYGWRSSIAAPIVVEGRLWGVMLVATKRSEPFPAGAEERLAAFTDLVSTAVANAQAQNALERVAAEQATLRRIATLVAQRLRPEEIFAAVIEEVGRLFGTELTIVGRFQDDPPAFVAAALGNGMQGIEVGSHWKLDDPLAATHVFDSGRSVRANERFRERSAALAETLARLGVVSTVASSVRVEGRLWGAVVVSSNEELPGDTEERLEKFTELVATAVANAESRSELAASRRRIVTASDETRRQIERDLHDGTQQRLVSLGLALRAAEATVPPDRPDLQADLSQIAAGLAGAVEDLQELSRGIHPAILSRGGLVPALRTLARRSAIPVQLDVSSDVTVPEPIEVAAYFVASEALANATKHAEASHIELSLTQIEGGLLLTICDDGVGGADPARGSGLVGLTDRVEALGGSLDVESRPGAGTQITARLPLELESVNPEEPI